MENDKYVMLATSREQETGSLLHKIDMKKEFNKVETMLQVLQPYYLRAQWKASYQKHKRKKNGTTMRYWSWTIWGVASLSKGLIY